MLGSFEYLSGFERSCPSAPEIVTLESPKRGGAALGEDVDGGGEVFAGRSWASRDRGAAGDQGLAGAEFPCAFRFQLDH